MNKKLTTLTTLALLLTATVAPAVFAEQAAEAPDSTAEFRLDLEAALAVGRTGLEPRSVTVITTPAAEEQIQFSALSQATARDVAVAKQETATIERNVVPKRGIGRWLKKHWYVPVLAGAAIGILVSDDDKDDPNEIDD